MTPEPVRFVLFPPVVVVVRPCVLSPVVCSPRVFVPAWRGSRSDYNLNSSIGPEWVGWSPNNLFKEQGPSIPGWRYA